MWVAELLTAPEKYARDRERYKINSAVGDKISYIHLNRPQFTLFGKSIEFDLKSRDWMLRLMTQAKILRKLLPGWHAKEKAFRDWYVGLVERFTFFESQQDYDFYVEALRVYEDVRGYRDIRYPLMEKAQKDAAEWIGKVNSVKTPAVKVFQVLQP